jgi:hypothetical protein
MVRELLGCNKLEKAREYMEEDAMYRFYFGTPKFVTFFGKSCSGKSSYLREIFGQGDKVVEVDRIFWKIFEKCFGLEEMHRVSRESRELVYSGRELDFLIKKYSTENFWRTFFEYIETNFKRVNFFLTSLKEEVSAFVLDFPSLGSYWSTMGAEHRGKLYLLKLENSIENRQKFMEKRAALERCTPGDKIFYLDRAYREPSYFDGVENLYE